MVVFPHAKINVGLHVLRKRTDGYHDIDTCFYPVPLTDILEAVPSEQFLFEQTGLNIPGNTSDNLCIKAYNLLKKEYGIPPVHLHLHKIIPMGAGLGGGSSDGAFTLKLLNSMFSLGLDNTTLETLAALLGSDCPFFIQGMASIGNGRGTELSPADVSLEGMYIRIIHPGVHISTAEAYAALTPDGSRTSVNEAISAPVTSWKGLLTNDFCQPAYRKFPLLKELEDKLYAQGAVFATMSGSGSSIFGIFEKEPESFKDPNFFIWTGKLA